MGVNIELWDKGRYEQMREGVLADATQRNAMMQRLTDLGCDGALRDTPR